MNKNNIIIIEFFTIISLIFMSNFVYADIYKWKSNNGQEIFSDMPPADDSKAELLELKRKGNTSRIINKTSNNADDAYKKQIKQYKKIREHHFDEDVSPKLHKLENTQGSLDHKNTKNCSIALSNLDSLKNSSLFLDSNKKIYKLPKSELNKKIVQTQKQIEKYCS